nr:DNA polymerase III subunit gamma and tau [Pseudonocardia halophobica]
MALALYRKYRPAKFAEVVGQEHVTEPLGTALSAGRINHAYLFSGPRGCGKTSSARILARSLNCVEGPTPDPCGVCASCVALAPEGPGNIDVVELDAASHGGVDDARELRDRAFYAPAESRYRVFIVDEAHMVTTQGFNALLKIVEEPPEHLVFVFATTEPDKVLPTIRSRTHHYPFRLIPPGTLRALLERICADEDVRVEPAVYPLVIRAGGGSARDTLSVLDQLLAGAGPEGVTYERAVALLGVTDVALIDDVVDALGAADGGAVFQAVDRLVEAGHDPRRFASDLLQRLRDLMLLQAVPEAAEQGLVEAADDELSRMIEQAARLGPATLTRYGEIVHAGLTEMRGATAPRLLLELLCARMLLPAATTSDAGLLERLERVERRQAIAPEPGAPALSGGSAPAGGTAPVASGGDAAPRFVRPSQRTRSGAPAARPAQESAADGARPPRAAEGDAAPGQVAAGRDDVPARAEDRRPAAAGHSSSAEGARGGDAPAPADAPDRADASDPAEAPGRADAHARAGSAALESEPPVRGEGSEPAAHLRGNAPGREAEADRAGASREATSPTPAGREASAEATGRGFAGPETSGEAAGRGSAGGEASGEAAGSREAAGQEGVGSGAPGRAAASEQEAPGREGTGRETAAGDALGRDTAGREPAGRESGGREAADRELAGRDSADRGSAGLESAGRVGAGARGAGSAEAAGAESVGGEARSGEAPGREASAREASAREASAREASARETSDRETSDREAPGRGAPGRGTPLEREAAARETAGPRDEPRRPEAPSRPDTGASAEAPPQQAAPSRPSPAAQPSAEPAAPAAAEAPAAHGLDASAVRRVWSEILVAARQRSRSTEALLVNATVRAVQDDTLVLSIASPPLARRLSDQRNTDVIVEALRAVLGVQWRVRCETGDGGGPAQPPPRQAAPRPAPQRPSRREAPEPERPNRPEPARQERPEPRRPAPAQRPRGGSGSDDGIPLPPEPPSDEPPPDDEEAMFAEADASRAERSVRRDPEEVAIELLSSQLGARAFDQR